MSKVKSANGLPTNMNIAGFTLVEILVAQLLLVIVLSLTYWLWQTFMQTASTSYTGLRNISLLMADLRVMTNHLREARDGEDGSYPLVIANDQEVAIFSDIDGDLVTERVRYFLEGTEMKRGVVEPTGDPPGYQLSNEQITIIGERIMVGTAPIFTYYNESWPGEVESNPLPIGNRLLNTRYIEVSLVVGQSEVDGWQPAEVTTGVHLRNLKQNY